MQENKEITNLLKEIVALLSVQIKRGVSQTTAIKELSEAGMQPKRIAEIVNTTPNTVRVALYHLKKSLKSRSADTTIDKK